LDKLHVKYVLPEQDKYQNRCVPFAVLVNIQQPLEEPPIVIFALLAPTSVIPRLQPNTMNQTTVSFAVR